MSRPSWQAFPPERRMLECPERNKLTYIQPAALFQIQPDQKHTNVLDLNGIEHWTCCYGHSAHTVFEGLGTLKDCVAKFGVKIHARTVLLLLQNSKSYELRDIRRWLAYRPVY